jgi:2,4-dienoyl-CoA reductase-like NADH-dependent reductase (Old Yellow Enzyme family)
MKKPVYSNLLKPLKLNGLKLKNRMTMAPLYLGYAELGGKVSPLMLYHYKLMAQSGVALIVVENSSITPKGSGSPRTLRCDHDRYIHGLESLAMTIKDQKTLAGLQINHAGRFAYNAEPVAPSAIPAFGKTPSALTKKEITTIQKQYAKASLRVQKAGFDLVELHGGTGYLLSQFVSPRTNKREDAYGGAIENRIRFPLEVVKRVKDLVGDFAFWPMNGCPTGFISRRPRCWPGPWSKTVWPIYPSWVERMNLFFSQILSGNAVNPATWFHWPMRLKNMSRFLLLQPVEFQRLQRRNPY